jgi:hypothetical protein
VEKKVRGDEKVSSAMLLVHSFAAFHIEEAAVPRRILTYALKPAPKANSLTPEEPHMSARKCPKCGMVSFATQESCKRCNSRVVTSHDEAEFTSSRAMSSFDDAEPRRGFSPLKVLLLILLFAVPLWYYTQSGISSAAAERVEDEKKQVELRRDRALCPHRICSDF